MFDSLKQAGKKVTTKVTNEVSRAWDSMSEGWRELLSRSGNALTHFARGKDEKGDQEIMPDAFPRWSLLAGEVEEMENEIVVRMEIPGIEKENCRITIEDNILHLSGEKHVERESGDSTYHLMERAYGAFERSIPLPRNVDTENAKASYKNGVLTVRMPRTPGPKAKSVTVS